MPPQDPHPEQPGALRLPPERALSVALGPDGGVRCVIGMEGDEPVDIEVGTNVATLLPARAGESDPWPARLAQLRDAPCVSLRFEIDAPEREGRTSSVPLQRVVRAVPIPGDDGELESILLRIDVAHEVGGLPDPDEERFRFLAESVPQMLWMARPEGTVEYLSPQWEAFSGVPVARLLADGYHSIIHPDDVGQLDAVVIDDDSYLMTPFRMRRADGEYRWMEAAIRTVRGPGGELLRTVGTTIDVTRRREDENERTVLTEQLRAALAISGVGRFAIDLATGLVEGDARHGEILGPPRDGPDAPRTLEEGFALVHPEDLAFVEEQISEALAVGVDYAVEHRIIRQTENGPEVRWVALRARAERVDDTPVRLIGVIADITDRRAEDAARMRSQKREAIGTLAGGIAHDFNNVISAIWSNASVAETEMRAGVSPETSIHEIKRGAERAADIVRRLLSFSREDKPERIPFDLVDVTREACELLRPTLADGVALTPPRPATVHPVLGSASQLHQVVVNLVGNAGDAAADGGGHVWVTIDEVHTAAPSTPTGRVPSTLPAGHYVRLTVRDDGPGIPAAVMPRIFDPFFTTKAIGVGTGLGLAAAQSIVRAHGGDIWADNEPGTGGAVFTVLLPVSEGELTPNPDGSLAKESMPPTPAVPRVVYVDDDPALAKLAARALPLHGCDVTVFTDASEALAALRAAPGRFDAVVVDLEMPGMSGLDLVEQARRICPELVIVISSGLISGDQRQRAQALGVGAILPKPVSMQDIADAILRLSAWAPAGSDAAAGA